MRKVVTFNCFPRLDDSGSQNLSLSPLQPTPLAGRPWPAPEQLCPRGDHLAALALPPNVEGRLSKRVSTTDID